MSDEKRAIITSWLGWKPVSVMNNGHVRYWIDENFRHHSLLPNFFNDDSVAISLMPKLVERGKMVNLTNFSTPHTKWIFEITDMEEADKIISTDNTIAKAISNGVLELINKTNLDIQT